MSVFTRGFLIDAGQAQFTTTLPAVRVYGEGRTYDAATGYTYAEADGTVVYTQNGFGYGSSGQLITTDVAGGAPAGSVVQNGLLFDPAGRLCVDGTNPAAYYSAGLPFASTGGLCSTGLIPAGAILTEGGDTMVTEGGDVLIVE